MDKKPSTGNSNNNIMSSSQDVEVRKGPWTMEEDLILINYIANHGEGVWNSLAKAAGLKRTGKSCRLRWLNYLRPDVRRGNITPEEQLLIMELHSKWGNRWSKIAKHLPGRTDNEIKNYWRTRIQKQIKQADPAGAMVNFNGQTSTSHHHHHEDHHHHQEMMNFMNSHEHAKVSTSQVSCTSNTDSAMESYCSSAPHSNIQNMETYPGIPTTTNENYWSVEDLWSMHLLNGD